MADRNPNQAMEPLDVLYDIAKTRFDYSIARLRHADTKVSVILGFLGGLLFASFEVLDWPCSIFLLPIVRFAPLVLIIVGTLLCLLALRPMKLRAYPKLDPLLADYKKKVDSGSMKADMIAEYKDAASENLTLGSKKNNLAKWALGFALLTFIVITILYVIKGVINVCKFR
jgi:hypothetical protein